MGELDRRRGDSAPPVSMMASLPLRRLSLIIGRNPPIPPRPSMIRCLDLARSWRKSMRDWYSGATRDERITDALERHQFDLLLALTPENAHYLAGHGNYLATHWRLPGLFSVAIGQTGSRAVVSADFGIDPAAQPHSSFHPYTTWIESIDTRGQSGATVQERISGARSRTVSRPQQFDFDEVFARIGDAARSVAPHPRRIGADLQEVDAASLARLQGVLPTAEIIDATRIFDALRTIKDPDEIEHLRLACELTEMGISAAIAELRPGMTELAVTSAYHIAIHREVMSGQRFHHFRQAEGLASVGIGAEAPHVVTPGKTVKFDMQIDIAGYHSDVGRTVAFEPTRDQLEIYNALRRALRAAQDSVRPEVSFAEIHAIGTTVMREQGFTNYSRGHLGHSCGLTQHFEEPPFIAPDEHRLLAPRMLLSLELPYYVYGVGAFQLERMLLVTEDGYEAFDRLPFELAIKAPNG
jgi:Xaa-Pro aminopeptidase